VSRLRLLHEAGQSVWLDFIERSMLQDGTLRRLIEEDALSGMTSNPTIFEKALGSSVYDAQIAALAGELEPARVFEHIACDDVRLACDIFLPLFEATNGRDGFVSIEVSPEHAHDAAGTVEEARRLWKMVGRPNAMIKVPGTESGLVAVRQLIAEGINVNVTLLFSLVAYGKVIEAYLGGLEDRFARGESLTSIASVASFFVSRVDTAVDRLLEQLATERAGGEREVLLGLRGKAAIANARRAYRLFRSSFAGERWARLERAGARLQRPLWASTSTKNPAYRAVMYVEELIGPDTVNTLPPVTLEAFRDHGVVQRTVDRALDEADAVMVRLAEIGVDIEGVTAKLLDEGVAAFQHSYEGALAGVERKAKQLVVR